MSSLFNPVYTISPNTAKQLMRIEAAKEKVSILPITPTVLSSLHETAKLYTTHYSTMIEGNKLNPNEVKEVIKLKGHFPGREREEHEIMGYYSALDQLEFYAKKNNIITDKIIKTLHALVMGNGKTRVKPTTYRDGQNIIKDSATGNIVYMPPEAKDVATLMRSLIRWINENNSLPCPIVAAISHYQFATIHPYYDGNGRTARLLTTLILHIGGYSLKGLYSLEEYYAKNLLSYYSAINIGPSHNYYLGRAEADISEWIEYFCKGMAFSCNKVVDQMIASKKLGENDLSLLMRSLDSKQRKALYLLNDHEIITSNQVGQLFNLKPRTSSSLCRKWVKEKFLEITDHSNKARKYKINDKFLPLIKKHNK
jgi:Fic family protein